MNYAYAGWNAASYVAGGINEPAKNVPRALLLGTISVLILYLLINISFIVSAPKSEMVGKKRSVSLPPDISLVNQEGT